MTSLGFQSCILFFTRKFIMLLNLFLKSHPAFAKVYLSALCGKYSLLKE